MQRRHRILFVLLACLGIVLLLCALTLALHADHYARSDHRHHRHSDREYGNEKDLSTCQTVAACLWRGLVLTCVVRRGRIGFLLALFAVEVVGANAMETVDAIYAGATVATGRRHAFVNVNRTIFTCETSAACAFVIVVQVRAGAAVGARFGQT